MPKIDDWGNLPAGVRQHLIDRMRDRAISIADLNRLRLWIGSRPEVPEGDWYKDFGSFKICGHGKRTAFLVELAQREIKLARQANALRAAKGAWRPEDHPELVEGAAPWVRSLRQQSLQRFEKIERHRSSQ
jgi:hypothetical protein